MDVFKMILIMAGITLFSGLVGLRVSDAVGGHGSILAPWVAVATCGAMSYAYLLWNIRGLQKKHASTLVKTSFEDIVYSMVVESSTVNNRSDLYHLILGKAVEAIPNVYKGTLLRLTTENTLVFDAAVGYDLEELKGFHLLPEETFEYVMTEGRCDRTVIINDFHAFNKQRLTLEKYAVISDVTQDIRSIMSAPIRIDGVLWGMINMDSNVLAAFGPIEMEWLGIFVSEIIKVIKQYDAQEENTFLLQRDVLTGLLNRRYFTDVLKSELSLCDKGGHGVLVIMDLDSFKEINDHYGHQTGDQALIHFARVFSGFISSGVYLSRYGGDEFAAIFPHETTDEVLSTLKEIEIRLKNTPIPGLDTDVFVRFSYGLAAYDEQAHEHPQLLHLADNRMYALKNSRKLIDGRTENPARFTKVPPNGE